VGGAGCEEGRVGVASLMGKGGGLGIGQRLLAWARDQHTKSVLTQAMNRTLMTELTMFVITVDPFREPIYLEIPALPLNYHLLAGGLLHLNLLVRRHPLMSLWRKQLAK